MVGNDPVCSGQGWLWEDAYGNRVTCWRCAGTGNVPNLVIPAQVGPITPQDEGAGDTRIETDEATNEGNP